MTIESQNKRINLLGNGTQTSFDFNFKVFLAEELSVYVDDALITSGYTVSGLGDDQGGSVEFTVPPAASSVVTLLRGMQFTQTADFISGDKFPEELHERQLDRQVMMIQQLSELLGRTLTAPPSSPLGFGIGVVNAGEFLLMDSSGVQIVSAALTDLVSSPFQGVISGLQEGDILVVRNGVFVNEPRGYSITLTNPQDGEALVYRNGQLVNEPIFETRTFDFTDFYGYVDLNVPTVPKVVANKAGVSFEDEGAIQPFGLGGYVPANKAATVKLKLRAETVQTDAYKSVTVRFVATNSDGSASSFQPVSLPLLAIPNTDVEFEAVFPDVITAAQATNSLQGRFEAQVEAAADDNHTGILHMSSAEVSYA